MTILEGLDMEFIIMEILPRLPAKTLIRFKSICKSLNSVISSRDFTRLYLRHQSLSSSAADKRLVLAGSGRIYCYHLDPPHATTRTTFFNYRETCPDKSIIGMSNGLLCICLARGNLSEYCILNPTTRIYRCIGILSQEHGVEHNYGFGFDHENLDYVIVVVSEYYKNSTTKTRITKLYSVNKNSLTVIEKTFPRDRMQPQLMRTGILIDNNLLHWLFWIPSLHKLRIGCFDICKKKWTDDVLLPRFYYDPTWKNKSYLVDFGVVDDCLFSTFRDGIDEKRRYNVWVMKEYGVQESWVVLLSVPVSGCFKMELLSPVASFQSSDLVLFLEPYTSRFFWYNKVDGGISEAKLDGAQDLWNLQAYMCSSSLVHLPGGRLLEHSEAGRKRKAGLDLSIIA